MKPASTTRSMRASASARDHARIPRRAICRHGRIDERRRNAFFGGEAERIARTVGKHERDLATQRAALLIGAQRTQVGAGARHAHGDATAQAFSR